MYQRKFFVFIVILLLGFHFANKCLGDGNNFLDLTKNYPEEQKDSNYLLYINGNPFKAPYITVKNQIDDTIIYYFPGRLLLNALGVEGNYDKEKNILIINQKEFPKGNGAIGLDMKTSEKILYLSFKDLLTFLKLPVRVQESSTGVSYYARTDGFTPSFQQIYPTATPVIVVSTPGANTAGSSKMTPNSSITSTPYAGATVVSTPKTGQQDVKDKLDTIVKPNNIPNANSLPTPIM